MLLPPKAAFIDSIMRKWRGLRGLGELLENGNRLGDSRLRLLRVPDRLLVGRVLLLANGGRLRHRLVRPP